ncbi:uncharacterized protein GGS22DRAFT_56637 [Annulohypoxylon maeteangense]|uniref:uncharacterized protein n=1 Tax=Annulohypoxylon maeteangense TaxID=1927788 RepID=UPI0020083202|nr:uncharacterized protein GGS22DRAFT_56637 [Annulohypoxylon maeteangense]KAI0881800.1 hypothetical protein GGS22DRAFT_56637 [Annulohypoxylon maeteangense]
MASSTKARQPRLRASCDGCFLAKVKCSKARPICSRCLACGIECRYSPSSRAGKPKSDPSGNTHANGPQDMQQMHHGMMEEKNITYSTAHQTPPEHMFTFETGWTTPPTSMDGGLSRNPSISTGLALLGVEDRTMGEHDPMSAPPEMYSSTMPWTPPTDLSCATFGDIPVTTGPIPSAQMRSQSFDMSMSTPMAWNDPVSHDMIAYNQVPTPTSMSSNYFPSPTTTPTMRPAGPRHRSSSSTINGGSCTCFTACLQSLQALHNASSPASPPFDFVLSLNRKAVEGCAAMLSCTKCMSRSGTHTATMLLATVIGKITSFYKTASHSYFEHGGMGMTPNNPGTNVGVSLGVYQLNGEDGKWLELEILARELRKLEEVYSRFREVVCTDFSDVPDVTKAMIGYLGQSLGSTLEVISHRKGDMTFIA